MARIAPRFGLMLLFATGCEPEPTAKQPEFRAAIKGTLHVVPSAMVGGAAFSSLTATCGATPQLTVRVFDVVSFLLSPATAKPLASCPVAEDGTFNCTDVNFGKIAQAASVLVDDTDDAVSDCVAPTSQLAVYCGVKALRDPNDAGCGGGKVLEDKVLEDGEAGWQPLVVTPRAWLAELDALAVPTGLHKPSESGVVLNIVSGEGATVQAGALPYLPSTCRDGTFQCRSLLLATDATGVHVADAARLTDATGSWVAQVEAHDANGDVKPIPLDTTADANKPGGFGAIDCSTSHPTSCFTIVPVFPHAAGVLKSVTGGASIGDVSINVIPREGTADNPLQCAAVQALMSADIAPEVYTCP